MNGSKQNNSKLKRAQTGMSAIRKANFPDREILLACLSKVGTQNCVEGKLILDVLWMPEALARRLKQLYTKEVVVRTAKRMGHRIRSVKVENGNIRIRISVPAKG